MKTQRTLNVKRDCRMALIDLYSRARTYGMESRTIDQGVKEIFRDKGADIASQKTRNYLRGFWEGYTQALQHTDIVYGRFINGQFYSVNRDRADYYEKHGIEPRAFAEESDNGTLGLYWSRHNGKRPYFLNRKAS